MSRRIRASARRPLDPADHRAGHSHGAVRAGNIRYLLAALLLIVAFMLVEIVVGVVSDSLVLISDAGHMLTDAASIALALVAVRLSTRPAQGRWTYGYQRAEILSAQGNGVTLLLLAVWFGYLAVRRLLDTPAVSGTPVLLTARSPVSSSISRRRGFSVGRTGTA